jgi:HD-GYP domain-containing protein (c-di-GMP phosphodiesterase class II)
MSPSPVDAASHAAADSNNPAFLRAVTQLGRRQTVVTSKAIYNQQGIKLLEGGVHVDADLYDRLISHRLAAPLDESMRSARPVTGSELREAAEAAMARRPFFTLMGPPGRVRDMLLQAIEAVPLPQPVAFHLTLVRETRPSLFEHGVLMAILAAHLVREGGAPIHDMTVAASAGLLHDLGMLHIDAELLEAGHRLNGDERRPLYVHPMTSSMLIARFHEYPNEVARAILEHHELLDGSGYPRGLVGEAISPLGRLLSLCEVVTAMFDGEREHPEQRVSVLLRVSPRRFDPALVPSIHRLLRAMPATTSDVTLTVADAVVHLQGLAGLLAQWHAAATDAATTLDAAGMAVLEPITEQAETLQRMLFEAGITPEQLDMLAGSAEADAGLRAELWVLTRELPWHLRAAAHQLQLRWRTAGGGRALPTALAGWLAEVEALEAAA